MSTVHGHASGISNGTADEDDVDYSDPTASFEKTRIRALKNERMRIQEKTFTKWCNIHLNLVRLNIEKDRLFDEVRDGIMLMRLLEIISGDKLGKPNKGRMEIHKIENLNRVLDYLKWKNIKLENIGAKDIYDRNEDLVLGLIWTIILRFQIENMIQEYQEVESSEKKSAKDALLLWCQRKTAGYSNVKIENFTTSWRNGLGFNALIHAHRPDLINYEGLNPSEHIGNLKNAFNVAEKHLGIAQLLDAEDVDVQRPDDKSIITYVSTYYQYFAKQKSESTGAKRIGKVVGQLISADKAKDEYEMISSNLLEWIREKVRLLSSRNFSNNLGGIQQEMAMFKQYRTVEKPPKFKEKGNLEALFFMIQIKFKALGQRKYVPRSGLNLNDIEQAWNGLELAEHQRQQALHEELIRQEQLLQLAKKFERKAHLRDSWLKDMTERLADSPEEKTIAQVEASVKKHEAITADILPREERFKDLSSMAEKLVVENYQDKNVIKSRERDILDKWAKLLKALDARKQELSGISELMKILRDMDTLSLEFSQLEPSVKSRDLGKHIVGVEDLLGKHGLVEAQITAQGERMKSLLKRANAKVRDKGPESEMLQRQCKDLQRQYDNLVQLAQSRRQSLERARDLFLFIQNQQEEESWIMEKTRICQSIMKTSDLTAVPQMQRSFKVLESEMEGHWKRIKQIIALGEELVPHLPVAAKDEIQTRLKSLQAQWDQLREVVGLLSRWLREAGQAAQYLQDANEAESWMKEKMPLVCSDDYGKDETSAEALLFRHSRLEEEIRSYKTDIQRLEDLATDLGKSQLLMVNGVKPGGSDSVKEVLEKQSIPQAQAIYAYSGHGMKVKKGEILALVNKSNEDWWRVVQQDGNEGFVPANYVREVDPKVSEVKVQKSPGVSSSPVVSDSEAGDIHPVQERQRHINSTYRRLNRMAEARKKSLENFIKLYRFNRECDEFEHWAAETERLLSEEVHKQHIEASRNQFDKLVTEITAAGGTRHANINSMADELIDADHNEADLIRRRQMAVNNMWSTLIRNRDHKASVIKTAETLADFLQTCEETQEWIQEKNQILEEELDANDPRAVTAMQKRHQNLERELRAVEEKMKLLGEQSSQVKAAHPSEASAVTKRTEELMNMWEELKKKAAKRRRLLEETQGHQMFKDASKNLLLWIEKTKDKLRERERPIDVSSAEDCLKQHQELAEDIKAKTDEFAYVRELGQRVLAKAVANLDDVKDQLRKLNADQIEIDKLWAEKQRELQDMLELQLHHREADHLDAVTKGHDAFLGITDTGYSVESVESLMKNHSNFENKLRAQDERMNSFAAMSDALILAKHPKAEQIDERRRTVVEARQAVKTKARLRRDELEAALAYHQFKRDSEELLDWMKEKMTIACDESYKDGANLDRKAKRHEAFEAEVKANADRLHSLNEEGNELVRAEHPRSYNINEIISDLNTKWTDLNAKAAERGDKIRQACDQKSLNRTLDDADQKLNEMENELASQEFGSDLRHVKKLLQKQQMLEQEMTVYSTKINEIVNRGEELAQKGHFDSEAILRQTADFNRRFSALKSPAAARAALLEQSRKFHQFDFDVDVELQWIHERLPVVQSADTGHSLTDTLNMHKKHQQFQAEISGHEPVIGKVLDEGAAWVSSRNPRSEEVKEKCAHLDKEWKNLCRLGKNRQRLLDISLKRQQYLSEATEVESWIAEKRRVLSRDDYGHDEDAATNLLNRHRATLDELSSYEEIIHNLKGQLGELAAETDGDQTNLEEKQRSLEKQFAELKSLCEKRRVSLEDAVCLFQYMRESLELENWISSQMQTAVSEDYGEDYEHLQDVMSKFEDFKQQVKTGSKRFLACEDAAKALLDRNPPFAADVHTRQEELRAAWSSLLDQIENREQKLEGAEEIHRFNRDAADALARTQEKYKAIPEDLGRDINSVQSLLKKQEAFENELVALEAHLQVLIEDSARLEKTYQGGNAQYIAEQQKLLIDSWNALQQKAVARREALHASYDLQRFYATARDLNVWIQEKLGQIKFEQSISDVDSVESARLDHGQIQSELLAHQEDFDHLRTMADAMLKAEHYASAEIENKVAQIEKDREILMNEWQKKEEWLKELEQLHQFGKEAKQIETMMHGHEVSLKSMAIGGDVEDVNSQLKRHTTFLKLLSSQEEKISGLNAHADRLIASKHTESGNIRLRVDDINKRWRALLAMADNRQKTLSDALLAAQFDSDVSETQWWIKEKEKQLMSAEQLTSVASLEDKMKHLQKHQAFEAELNANKQRIDQIQLKSSDVSRLPTSDSRKIDANVREVVEAWLALARTSQERSRNLEEAKDILEFNQLVERVMAWIREEEMLVQAGDVGRDYEHCLSLQKKLNDAETDSGVDEQTISNINSLGQKLVSQGKSENKIVEEKLKTLNQKWRNIQNSLSSYRALLTAAVDVHAFNRDVDDTRERIDEKIKLLSSQEISAGKKDLASVESLLRKQQALERDMSALQEKIFIHEKAGRMLLSKRPPLEDTVNESLANLLNQWGKLLTLARERRRHLSSYYSIQSFLDDVQENKTWFDSMARNLKSYSSPSNINQAQALLHAHNEKRAEIDGRLGTLNKLKAKGLQLKLPPSNDPSEDDQKKWREAFDLFDIDKNGSISKTELANTIKLCGLQPNDQWINDLLGGASSIEWPAFKQYMMKDLSGVANDPNPGDAEKIDRCLEELDRLKEEINDVWSKEAVQLQKLYELQLFNESVSKAKTWLISKERFLANEDLGDSLDQVDILLKQHNGFSQAMMAQSEKIDQLQRTSIESSEKDADHAREYKRGYEEVETRYQKLLQNSKRRESLLRDSRAWHTFLKRCYEIMNWLNTKLQIAYDESYQDPTNLQSKLQKHATFDAELRANNQRIEKINEEGNELVEQGHFAKDQIKAQLKEVNEGWRELMSVSGLKQRRLQDAYQAYQFTRRVEDTDQWLDVVESQLVSDDHGKDVMSVNKLLKKHEGLLREIDGKKEGIDELRTSVAKFQQDQHFMINELEQKFNHVSERFKSLQEPCSIRGENLRDAEALHKWLREIDEESAWIRERKSAASSSSFGDSLQTSQNLQKRHQILSQEITDHEPLIRAIIDQGAVMRRSNHFASARIDERSRELEKEWEALKDASDIRRLKLQDALESQMYFSETAELTDWIRETQVQVNSRDTGKDEDSAQILQKRLELIQKDVEKHRGIVGQLSSRAADLVQRHHFDADNIESTQKRLETQFAELQKSLQNRRQQLADAGRYYAFLRLTDDLAEWLKEKESAANSEDYGKDLEHCQELIGRFDMFMKEIASGGERVAAVQRQQEDLLRTNHPYSASVRARGMELQQLWADVNEAAVDRQQALLGARQVHNFDQDADETLNWLQEKEAVLVAGAGDDFTHSDLSTNQAMFNRHEAFMRELAAVEKQVDDLSNEAERLMTTFPDTRQHIQVRRSDMQDALADVLAAAKQRELKLQQAGQLQAYFDDYRALIAWISEITGMIHGTQLARDVSGAESLVHQHAELKVEIDSRQPAVNKFVTNGEEMMRKGHLLSNEIEDKVNTLNSSFLRLLNLWEIRKTLYEQNLDVQLWKRDASSVDAWLGERKVNLGEDWRHADSVRAVDEMIRAYDDFLTTVNAQGEKCSQLERLTMIEQAMTAHQQNEVDKRKQEDQYREKQRKDQIRTVERQKILQERRQERGRRRTQEIQNLQGGDGDVMLSSSSGSRETTPTVGRRRDSSSGVAAPSEVNGESQISVSGGSPALANQHYGSLDRKPILPPKPALSPKPGLPPSGSGLFRPKASSSAENVSEGMSPIIMDAMPSQTSSVGRPPQAISTRRGSADLRKVQSMRIGMQDDPKFNMRKERLLKKTPSFTTRRPQSLKAIRKWDDMKSIEKEGVLERKQESMSGGKRATIRTWKSYYTILCGQLICFFKDEESFMENNAAAPPVNILHSVCSAAPEYTKKKNVFKLVLPDGAEFLFGTPNEAEMRDWVAKVEFHSKLPPSMQLQQYDERSQLDSEILNKPTNSVPSHALPPSYPQSEPPGYTHSPSQEHIIASQFASPAKPSIAPRRLVDEMNIPEQPALPPRPPATGVLPRMTSEPRHPKLSSVIDSGINSELSEMNGRGTGDQSYDSHLDDSEVFGNHDESLQNGSDWSHDRSSTSPSKYDDGRVSGGIHTLPYTGDVQQTRGSSTSVVNDNYHSESRGVLLRNSNDSTPPVSQMGFSETVSYVVSNQRDSGGWEQSFEGSPGLQEDGDSPPFSSEFVSSEDGGSVGGKSKKRGSRIGSFFKTGKKKEGK